MPSPTADPATVGVSAEQFGWPLARLACSVHHSFVWNGSAVDRKSCVSLERSWGERHRLSLLAQFAAHQSFLSFAGLPDHDLDPREWLVARARGGDVRLIRIAGGSDDEWSGVTAFDRVAEFARYLHLEGISAIQRPWGRPDHFFAEAREKLRQGQAADLTSVGRAAFGMLLPPGPESLEQFLRGPVRVTQSGALVALEHLAGLAGRPFILIGGPHANPLAPGSGLAALESIGLELPKGDPDSIAEALAELKKPIVSVDQPERLDSISRSVVDLLVARGRQIVIRADERSPGGFEMVEGPGRLFVVSSSAEAGRTLLERISAIEEPDQLLRLAAFCESDSFDRFLSVGEVPAVAIEGPSVISIGEPSRSFVAALSLMGRRVDLETANRFLERLGARVGADELVIEGIASIAGGSFIFESDETCRLLQGHLPPEMVESLIDSALDLLGPDRPLARFGIKLRRGDRDGALSVLNTALDRGEIDSDEARDAVRSAGFTPGEIRHHESVAVVEAASLLAAGRYSAALELVDGLEDPEAVLIAARASRRLGRYEQALSILHEAEPSFPVALLRGILHRLEGHPDLAREDLEEAERLVKDELESVRLGFERALLSIDLDEKPSSRWKRKAGVHCPWLVARFEAYQAIADGRFGKAAESSRQAIERAPDRAEEIDAHVDLVYSRFMSGDWKDAATAARDALRIVEETEGDRAGGGLLYILGFLSADSGRWAEAESALRKLETFYEENRDDRRVRELDLIRAQIALGRLDRREARRAASRVEACDAPEIRYAARLVLDELDWIAGSLPMLRVDGKTKCAELARRTELIRVRAGMDASPDGFLGELARFELAAVGGDEATPPVPVTASERLMVIRSIEGIRSRTGRKSFEAELDLLCEDAGIDRRTSVAPLSHRLLVALATIEMPPAEVPIAGIEWRFAVRNRLGTWRQYGSLPHCESNQLDVVAIDADVIRIGDFGLLWLKGEIEWTDELREAVASLWRVKWEHRNLVRLNEQMTSTVRDDVPISVDGIIGESVAVREALRPLPYAARSDLAVSVEGETGTGKELVARAIHRRSSRRGRPFTPVNCGALPENLIESELFGHARGAFTGADRDRVGLIEASDGGTLFLDEIGELPLPAQAKLLRFLQEGEFRRVGETEMRTADVRIIAATNRRLEKEVDDGTFRQDLYYRICGIEISLPPLRRRGHDVMLLARKFLSDAREMTKAGPNGFTEDVEALFAGYDWPGNVRDLQNVVSWAFSLAGDAPLITVDHLPQRVRNAMRRASKRGSFYEELAQFRRHLIEQSLLEAGGNQSRAAKSLGMTRQALAYQIKELGIHVRKSK